MKKLFQGIIFIFILIKLPAQNTYTNLVFEGAGIRGLAYAGAVMELEERDMIKDVEKVGGTSAGAIIATAIALGYSGEELKQLVSSMKTRKFNDGHFFFIGGFYRISKYFGWYRGKKFEHWIADVIEKKTGNPDITFKELDSAGYKDLYITGTSLNRQELLVFSKATYPDMKVKDAVRASMSIPLYYRAVFIDKDGKVIEKPKKRTDLDLVVDGGITGNFPIQLFDEYKNVEGEEVRIPNPNTLGFRIDTDVQITYDTESKGLAPLPITNLSEYIFAFYNFTLESLNSNLLNQEDWQRTVSISSAGIGPKVKKLTEEQKNLLIESGRNGVKEYLNQ